MGISRSVDEGRVNPETSEAYHAFCREVFGNQRKPALLSMTDGNQSYRCRCEECKFWFEQHFWVNHSAKPHAEFSRPLEAVVANIETLEERPAVAGTMTIDPEWGLLKTPLPRNVSAKTAKERERCDLLVRASQFRRML